jgi:hypothetical protein
MIQLSILLPPYIVSNQRKKSIAILKGTFSKTNSNPLEKLIIHEYNIIIIGGNLMF